jgi:hypothetical protein
MARSTQPDDNTHLESNSEYHSRVQRRMDEDSFQGVDTVGARFPERAIVHDMTGPDDKEPPHVYNWGPKKAGY